jgi:hypothetical protein
MNPTIYRVQDRNGRGPWKPGFSHKWIDVSRTSLPPTIAEDFGHEAYQRIPAGFHVGCGVRSPIALHAWFTKSEAKRLDFFGYYVAELEVDWIMAESATQLLFARRKRLNTDLRQHPMEFIYS